MTNIFAQRISLRVVSEYCEGMDSLLNGREFANAFDGLSEAKNVIFREENAIQNKIDELSGQLLYRRQRIDYWRGQLRKLQRV